MQNVGRCTKDREKGNLKVVKDCKHEWYVFAVTHEKKSLLLQCRKCKMYGVVNNPTKEEWKEAEKVEKGPYMWEDNSRVVIWPGSL